MLHSRIELELPCQLTDEEVQSRGRMLGETVSTIDEVETARTNAMKTFKQRLEGLNEQQRKLALVIRERVQMRLTRCAVIFHSPCEGVKRVVRLDTGEQVREEPMTETEKQLNLFAAQAEFQAFMASNEVEEIRPDDPGTDAEAEPDQGADDNATQ